MLAVALDGIRLRAAVGGPLCTLAIALSWGVGTAPPAAGQTALVLSAESSEAAQASFTLPTQSSDAADALDQFQRLVAHEQWEKAFAALEELSKKGGHGFIDRGDGVLVPSTLLVRRLLAELPGGGRRAYRLFYDSQATQLWEQAHDAAEAEKLSAIVAGHLVSSLGDKAADRLGDLHFERGEFEQAAGAWRTLLEGCPDSGLSRPLILAKLATALARAERWEEFGEVDRQVRQRFAAEPIAVGGRQWAAAAYLDELAPAASRTAPGPAALPDDLELPADNGPAWRFAFQTPLDADAINQLQMVDVYGQYLDDDFYIPADVDERRCYVNLFGVEMAFDLRTGKLAWRVGKLHDVDLRQAQQGLAPERYSVQALDGRVWSVSRDPKEANSQGPFYLFVRDAATGRELFSSRRTLSSWSVLGAPCLAGDVAYVGALANRQGRELSVLALAAADGKLQKTIPLGTFAVDQNQLHGQSAARPTFAVRGGRVFVDTHAGALAAIDPQRSSLEWAIRYDSPPTSTDYYARTAPQRVAVSGPLVAGGLVFAKGMNASRLLGIAADGPRVAWNRPLDAPALLIAVDGQRIYLGGEELAAFSLETQALLWATRLPRSVAWSVPYVTANRLYQFTSRGICEVDKATGAVLNIFRGNDLDSQGGSLFVSGGNLITVSNVGITAYRLNAPSAP